MILFFLSSNTGLLDWLNTRNTSVTKYNKDIWCFDAIEFCLQWRRYSNHPLTLQMSTIRNIIFKYQHFLVIIFVPYNAISISAKSTPQMRYDLCYNMRALNLNMLFLFRIPTLHHLFGFHTWKCWSKMNIFIVKTFDNAKPGIDICAVIKWSTNLLFQIFFSQKWTAI